MPYAFSPDYDPDLFWHLNLGRDIFSGQASPFIDHFSHSFAGQSIRAPPLGFEATAYFFYKFFGGLWGLQVFKALLWILGILLTLVFSQYVGLTLPYTCGLVLFTACTYQIKFLLRPDTFTIVLFPGFLILIFELKKNWSFRFSLFVGLLLMVWSNWHFSSLLAYAVVLAARCPSHFSGYSAFLKNLTLLFILILPGFLNPTWEHPLGVFLLHNESGWRSVITELMPPQWGHESALITVFSALSLLAALYFLWVKKFFEGLVILIFFSQMLQSQKMMLVGATLNAPLVFLALASVGRGLNLRYSRLSIVRVLTALAIFCFSYLCAQEVYIRYAAPEFSISEVPPQDKFPFDFYNESKNLDLRGKVWNSFTLGGWIGFYFPDLKVNIDGRTNILFPLEHFQKYLDVSSNLSAATEYIQTFEDDYIFLDLSQSRSMFRAALKKYKLLWQSNHFAVLSRGPPYFPQLTALLDNQNCLPGVDIKELKKELELATRLYGPQSPFTLDIQMLVESMSLKTNSEKFGQWRKEHESEINESDFTKRWLSQLDTLSLSYNRAIAASMSTQVRIPSDYIKVLHLSMQVKDPVLASETLKKAPPPYELFQEDIETVLKAVDFVRLNLPERDFSPSKIEIYRKFKVSSPPQTLYCSNLKRLR